MNIKEFIKFKKVPSIYVYYDIELNRYVLNNINLTSLEGLPDDFNDIISFSFNKLENLKGLPKNFNSKIWLLNNEIETLEGLNDVLDPKKIIGLDKDFIISEYKRLGKHHLLI